MTHDIRRYMDVVIEKRDPIEAIRAAEALANHKNTSPEEAEAARNAAARLRKAYDISGSVALATEGEVPADPKTAGIGDRWLYTKPHSRKKDVTYHAHIQKYRSGFASHKTSEAYAKQESHKTWQEAHDRLTSQGYKFRSNEKSQGWNVGGFARKF